MNLQIIIYYFVDLSEIVTENLKTKLRTTKKLEINV